MRLGTGENFIYKRGDIIVLRFNSTTVVVKWCQSPAGIKVDDNGIHLLMAQRSKTDSYQLAYQWHCPE